MKAIEMTTFSHRGYTGSVEYSDADGVYHGKILNTPDLVTYEAETPSKLKIEFEDAVDDYISYRLKVLLKELA
jgi:predicted HicB family RNase H-like nuclease